MNSAFNHSNAKPGLRPARPVGYKRGHGAGAGRALPHGPSFGNWREQATRLLTRATLLLLLVLGSGVGGPVAVAAEAPENQVKAAFLLNFPKYVEWPADSFAATNSPLVVVILGDPELSATFSKMSAGKIVNGRPLVVTTELPRADNPGGCHLLFVSATARRSAELLAGLKGRSVLTVGDDERFLEQGGVIRLVRRDDNIRLRVQLSAAQHARLKISSKLLSVADVVKGGN